MAKKINFYNQIYTTVLKKATIYIKPFGKWFLIVDKNKNSMHKKRSSFLVLLLFIKFI